MGDRFMKKRRKCLNCGKDITLKQKQRKDYHYKYCSRSCHYNARFGEVIPDETIETRNPLLYEAIKLCQSGMNMAQAAKQVGVHPRLISDCLYKSGEETIATIFADRVCGHCGISLVGMQYLSGRKYCSESCQKESNRIKNLSTRCKTKDNSALRKEALELYWSGLSMIAIAEQLHIGSLAVSDWVHEFGSQKERAEPFTPKHRIVSFKQRLQKSETADEWLSVLRDKVSETSAITKATTIHLVCGSINGHSAVNRLVTIISERLKTDPLNGDIFAFCNKNKNIITTFSWKSPVFNITKHIKMHGTFVWADENLGKSIEVTANEFEYLISYCKTKTSANTVSVIESHSLLE